MSAELGALIAVPLLFGILCVLVGWSLDKQHAVLKAFLQIFALFSSIPALWAAAAAIDVTALPDLASLIGTLTTVYSWVWYIVIAYWMLYLFWTLFTTIGNSKKQSREARYGG